MHLGRFLPLVLLVAALGCAGDDGPKLYKVTGRAVYNDGSPVPQGTIVFVNADRTVSSYGVLDQNGQYSLITGEKPGAPAGSYTVFFTTTSPPPDYVPTQAEVDEAALSTEAITPGTKPALVADKYKSAESSGITRQIPEQDTQVDDVQVER